MNEIEKLVERHAKIIDKLVELTLQRGGGFDAVNYGSTLKALVHQIAFIIGHKPTQKQETGTFVPLVKFIKE